MEREINSDEFGQNIRNSCLGLFCFFGLLFILAFGNDSFVFHIPGWNVISCTGQLISCIIYLIVINTSVDMRPLWRLKRSKDSSRIGRITHTKDFVKSIDAIEDGRSWFSSGSIYYWIALNDIEFGEKNTAKVRETIKCSPRIIWVTHFFWMALSIALGIIPIPVMTAVQHTAGKDFIEYWFFLTEVLVTCFTSLCAVACAVISLKISRKKHQYLYECAKRIVHENSTSGHREKLEDLGKTKDRLKWYYNCCPNCGADAVRTLKHCASCGTSLLVQDFDGVSYGEVHHIVGATSIDRNIKNAPDLSSKLVPKLYKNCPNCGAVRAGDETECSVCGTSLFVVDEEL